MKGVSYRELAAILKPVTVKPPGRPKWYGSPMRDTSVRAECERTGLARSTVKRRRKELGQ